MLSLRDRFPDAWYDLHNRTNGARGAQRPPIISFETTRDDFPANSEPEPIEQVTCYVLRSGASSKREPEGISLAFTPAEANATVELDRDTNGGVISTRGRWAAQWAQSVVTAPPIGKWQLALRDDAATRSRLDAGEIEDILLAITYDATLPPWPT